MAVKIRLKRLGAKKNPFYRIVVADSRNARDGSIIDHIRNYDPKTKVLNADGEKVAKWIANGAQPSETVRSILKKNGIIE